MRCHDAVRPWDLALKPSNACHGLCVCVCFFVFCFFCVFLSSSSARDNHPNTLEAATYCAGALDPSQILGSSEASMKPRQLLKGNLKAQRLLANLARPHESGCSTKAAPGASCFNIVRSSVAA